jgi:uncharacterized protein (TIGR03437 family)
MRLFALLLAPGLLLGQLQLAPGSLGTISYFAEAPLSAPYSASVFLRPVGASALISAPVISVDGSEITFVVPQDVPLGPAQAIYKVSGDTTKWVEVDVVPANFTITAIQTATAAGTANLNDLSHPVQPGQSVALWGTGLGLTPASSVGVTLGGVAQKVQYAGPAPNLIGVNQVNFQVSAGVPDGCYLPVIVSVGQSSSTTYLAKTSDGSPCPHPFHLAAADLQNLDRGNVLEVGEIQVQSNIVAVTPDHASRQESASVSFSTLAGGDLANAIENNQWPGFYGLNLKVGAQKLSSIDVSNSVTLPANDAPLASLPPPVFGGGATTWSNSGGSDLAASSFSFNLLPPIQLNGQIPLQWASGKDQTITWNPAGYDATAILQASLSGANVVSSGIVLGTVGTTIAAANSIVLPRFTAPASSGSLTIPASLLTQIGPGALTLVVQVSEPFASSPSALLQLTNHTTLLMLVNASTGETVPVDIQ